MRTKRPFRLAPEDKPKPPPESCSLAELHWKNQRGQWKKSSGREAGLTTPEYTQLKNSSPEEGGGKKKPEWQLNYKPKVKAKSCYKHTLFFFLLIHTTASVSELTSTQPHEIMAELQRKSTQVQSLGHIWGLQTRICSLKGRHTKRSLSPTAEEADTLPVQLNKRPNLGGSGRIH